MTRSTPASAAATNQSLRFVSLRFHLAHLLTLTDPRWRWRRHARPVVLAGLAFAAKVRLGRDAAGKNRLGKLSFYSHSSFFYSSLCLYRRDSIGTAHRRPMRSHLSQPSHIFYLALVPEDGPRGVSMPTRASSSWDTRMVDKAHGI